VDQTEWLRRYKERMLAVGVDEQTAHHFTYSAVDYDELRDSFEDEPEQAADEELSYWTE
jgi:hypothetical protein